MRASWRVGPVILLLLLIAIDGHADTASARSHFAAGVTAFEAADLVLARSELEKARALGLASTSLSYNLGVVYYRLADFDLSAKEFTRLLATSHRTLAMYNLGLVALGKDNHPAARDWFLAVTASDGPQELKALAERQLQKLRAAETGSELTAGRRWTGFVTLSGGYDDNIASAPESASSGQSGSLVEALLAMSGFIAGDNNSGVRLEAAAFTRRFPSQQKYNTDLVRLGMGVRQDVGVGRLVATVSGSQAWLDSRELERQLRLDLGYELDRCTGLGARAACKLTLSGSDVSGGENYEPYDGEWYRVAIKARKRISRWRLEAEYRYEYNDREDLDTFWEFYSVSPRRHFIELGAHRSMTSRLQVGVEAGYRHSKYNDPHRLFSGPVLATRLREDERVEGALVGRFALNRRWVLSAEWKIQDNDSSIARYEYVRQTAQLGVEGVF